MWGEECMFVVEMIKVHKEPLQEAHTHTVDFVQTPGRAVCDQN